MISGVGMGVAAENIAAGTHSWAQTFRMWFTNANLLQSPADRVGFAVARNAQTRYKTFWAIVIAEGAPSRKGPRSRHMRKARAPSGDVSKSAQHGQEFRLQVSVPIVDCPSPVVEVVE